MRTIIKTLLVIFVAGTAFAGGSGEATATSTELDLTDPQVLKDVVEDQELDYLLVDVRTPQEYSGGHIPTAINVDYRQVDEGLADVDRDQLVIVYCRSGNRSGQAFTTLESMGFTNLVDFGGINRWEGELAYP